MPEGKAILFGASRLVLAGVTTLLTAGGFSGVEASQFHRRDTSIYGPRPAYWGTERSVPTYRDIWGWRHARFKKSHAAIGQLDPRLRGNDGRLLEEVGGPSRANAEPGLCDCILPLSQGGPHFIFVPGRFQFHHFRRR
jgi:hypothetical protein